MYVLQTDHKFVNEKDFESLQDWVRDTTEGYLIMLCGTVKNSSLTSMVSCARGDAIMLVEMLCTAIINVLTQAKLPFDSEEIIKKAIPECLLTKLKEEEKSHADD